MANYYALHKDCGGHLGPKFPPHIVGLGVGQSVYIDYTPVCQKCGKRIETQWEIDIGDEIKEVKQCKR